MSESWYHLVVMEGCPAEGSVGRIIFGKWLDHVLACCRGGC